MPPVDYLAAIGAEGALLLAAASDDLDAAVPSCPGWDRRRLVRHAGRLLNSCARMLPRQSLEPPERVPAPPPETAPLLDYYRRALDDLLDVLSATDPAAPAWNPFDASPRVEFWHRRLAAELLVHHWDACLPGPAPWRSPPERVVDAVEERLAVLLPGERRRGGAGPDGTVHVHLTDAPGEWLVRLAGPEVEVSPGHLKGDAVLRGEAVPVLLALWGRDAWARPVPDTFGPGELVDALRSPI
jgi:uncharacterized protein (TIGR03083 family)